MRGPQDALDLLCGVGVRTAPPERAALEPDLRAVLEQVGAGRDTLAKLTASGARQQETLVALARLELARRAGAGRRRTLCALSIALMSR